VERRAIEIRGIVQGVGFRPFVYTLASRLNLSGYVTNTTAGVSIEVEGEGAALDRFERELVESPPPLARIESVVALHKEVRGERDFRIEASRTSGVSTVFVSPDAATCDACLHELFDPRNRRYRYPFITCTTCGPRLTIVTGAPYDRDRTTMVGFEMCAECRREYTNPSDRRFHAEAIACAVCGPQLIALDEHGRRVDGNPLVLAARAIMKGRIVAVKGLGGFHLACDAANAASIAELRRRKHRDDKPFAIMVRDLPSAEMLCRISEAEAAFLTSAARPIVLLQPRSVEADRIVELVAPETNRLGVMLPYTPIHHLLLDEVDRCCRLAGDVATDAAPVVVMTSGNRSDEPIATANEDAVARLSGIADLFVVHDRAIHVRCDDSVVEHAGSSPTFIRRSRGYAPAPIPLPFECADPILAVGGQLKNTFAVGRRREAFVSHHIGDLDDARALEAYERDLTLFEQMLQVDPAVIAYDAHPDYASTRVALARTASAHVAVQHHHAHVASCMAEHGIDGPVIGVAWDGAGWGPDDRVWGGEFLICDYRTFERAGHFRYVALPGGDKAAREPWRMAVAHLQDSGLDVQRVAHDGISSSTRAAVIQMIERRIQCPMTSSVGRLFDAVASICGIRHVATYEGQAAMQLQAAAVTSHNTSAYPLPLVQGSPLEVDTRQLIQAVAADSRDRVPAAAIARRFHASLAASAAAVCNELRAMTGLARVVLTGGVFLNALLASDLEDRLVRGGFEVYRHRVVPPGDGGLSLGQLAVAAARLAP
jgi:hydrogenase maturation protein HypF